MPIPHNKISLQAAMQKNFSSLLKVLENIAVEDYHKEVMEGHLKDSKMSVHNLLSYLLGWGELVLKWQKQTEEKIAVDFPETGYKWNELGLLAQKFYKDYAHLSAIELLEHLKNNANSLLMLVADKSEEELYTRPWYKEYTLGRMIQLNSASPYDNAAKRLKKALKSQIF